MLLVATIVLALPTAQAQEKGATNAPVAVKKAFEKRFPNAEHVEWDMEDANIYEAEFKWKGIEHSANYSATGVWMETEMEVKEATLPDAVRKALKMDYADHKVKECESVEKPDSGMHYEVELSKQGETAEVVFDVTGKVLSAKATSKLKVEEKD